MCRAFANFNLIRLMWFLVMLVRMGYWPSVRSRWLDIGQVEVHKLAKKERGQYPAILTEQAWSIKDLLYGFRGNFSCGIRRVVPSGQDSSILPAHGASHIINTFSPRAHYARGMWKTEVSLWKRIKCFPSTRRQRNLKTQQSPVILDLCLRRFQIPPVWRAFSRSSIFVADSVDGWPNSRNEAAFSNFSNVVSTLRYWKRLFECSHTIASS